MPLSRIEAVQIEAVQDGVLAELPVALNAPRLLSGRLYHQARLTIVGPQHPTRRLHGVLHHFRLDLTPAAAKVLQLSNHTACLEQNETRIVVPPALDLLHFLTV